MLLAPVAGAETPVVTVDAATLKSTCQQPISMFGPPNWKGREFRLGIRNNAYAPVSALVKVPGVKAESYDVYIDERSAGTLSKADIENGITVDLSGGGAPASQRKILEALDQPMKDAEKLMQPKDHAVWPYWHLYSGTQRWVSALLSSDGAVRTSRVILVESGFAPRAELAAVPSEPEQVKKRVGMLLVDIENLRQLVAASTLAAETKAQHLGFIVPVGVFLSGDSESVTLRIENSFNQPVTGSLDILSPSGAFAASKVDLKLAPDEVKEIKGKLLQPDAEVKAVLRGKTGTMTFTRQITLKLPEIKPDSQ